MKKLFPLLIFSLFTITILNAQSGNGFGIRAGLNFNSHGEVSSFGDFERTYGSNLQAGFHIGAFAKLDLLNTFYFKPELVFTRIESRYALTELDDNDVFKMSKLDLPLLVGIKIVGPVHIFLGPSLQYILDTDISTFGLSVDNLSNDFSIGLNAGIGANFGKLGIDVRYERGLSKNEADLVADFGFGGFGTIDTRPEQVILSLSYRLL